MANTNRVTTKPNGTDTILLQTQTVSRVAHCKINVPGISDTHLAHSLLSDFARNWVFCWCRVFFAVGMSDRLTLEMILA